MQTDMQDNTSVYTVIMRRIAFKQSLLRSNVQTKAIWHLVEWGLKFCQDSFPFNVVSVLLLNSGTWKFVTSLIPKTKIL